MFKFGNVSVRIFARFRLPTLNEEAHMVRSGTVHLVMSFILLAAVSIFAYIPPSLRSVTPINKTWTFIRGLSRTSGAQASGYSDASWSKVNLPHSFDIPYWRVNSALTPTYGWYRKHFSINQSIITAGNRVFIEFGAVFLVSTVYINGDSVGVHKGGYTGFSYDITPYIHAGDNVLAVYDDGSWNGQVAPRGGEHIFIGGIYRDVNIVVTAPLHVTWYGTFVSTPQVSSTAATVKVSTEIKNDSTGPKNCTVVHTVVDSAGNEVTSFQSTMTVPAGVIDTLVASGSVANPNLWSPSTPYMYTVYSEVYDGSTPVDNFVSPLGIRSVSWSASTGFSLNGQRLWLQGCDAHQDHAGWGDATTDSGPARDVRLIRQCGMNFIRGSHYPHHPSFSDACDKQGICLWEEMCFWSVYANSESGWTSSAYPDSAANQAPFEANCIQQLTDMIRIHRNHPSVILWSMGNEIWFTTSSVLTNAKNLAIKMMATANQLDSTRRAGLGGTQLDNLDVLTSTEVSGYNGTGASTLNPSVANMVTEYGSCYENRPGYYAPCYGSVQTQMQNGDSVPIQYAWRGGVALWCAFHHGSDIGTGNMGMMDHARLPLERWYWYRNLYTGIAPPTWPVAGTAAKLMLTTDNSTLTDDGKSDCQLIVQVQNAAGTWISNSPNITLTDGSGLGAFPTGTSITFIGGDSEDCVRNGLAAIEYRSYTAGTATITATSPGLTSSSVTITINHVVDSIGMVGVLRNGPARPGLSLPGAVIKTMGGMLRLPYVFYGKKVAMSVFDLNGVLVDSRIIARSTDFVQLTAPDKAQKMYIVKLHALKQ